MTKYIRSKIKSFYELSGRQLLHARNISGLLNLTDLTYWVDDPLDVNNCIPLSSFMPIKAYRWDGVFALSHFNGYLIKLSKSGDCAVVAYRHW